ncbi:lipopolysaccharide biosynthesis protein [Bacillus daqingensis]|uniref:Lipopolysaccharide biosynthesis protein n=1 Tax=Bacillus daqingensis TaxID=872396 RepID=A0ABV9NSJ7_9BACI
MRTKKSIYNLLVAIIGHVGIVIANFFSRKIFIDHLGIEYLGVYSLFNNIIAVLSLAELGIGIALIYCMYEPLEKNQINLLKALMEFYKKIYISIGLFILLLGLCLMPFVQFIVSEEIPNIEIIFLLSVVNSTITYFLAYKRSILIADQKSYIVNFYHYVFMLITIMVQIIGIIIYPSLIVFLAISAIFKVIENILILRKANNIYPFIINTKGCRLSKEYKANIFKHMKGLAYHKVGSTVSHSSDNIILSIYTTISLVGIYSNYLLITNTLKTIVGQGFQSITASVGNYITTKKENEQIKLFNNILFSNAWIFGISSLILFFTFNLFIEMWIGENYLLNKYLVAIIVINFYLIGYRKAVITFKNAHGLFWQDRYKSIVEALFNILISIILVQYFGLLGILIGTFISNLFISYWIEAYVLYKYGFKVSVINYYFQSLRYIIDLLVIFVAILVILNLMNLTNFSLVVQFISNILITLIIVTFFILLFYKNDNRFKFFLNIIVKTLKLLTNKIKRRA